MTVTWNRTNLITQDGLDSAGINLDLSIEDAGEVAKGTTTGTGNEKDGPVKDLDLLFGNYWSLYEVRKRQRDHIIFNLLGGRGISKEELVRKVGHPLDENF